MQQSPLCRLNSCLLYTSNYHSPFYRPVSYITPNEYAGIIGKGQQDKDGNMWFATEGAGLFYYNPENGRQQLYPIKPLHEGNYEINIIKSILIQGDSILCSTHFGSVYLFSIRDKQYKKLYDFQHNDIFSLYIDKSKRLWICLLYTSRRSKCCSRSA